jgi:hypothetical protein
VADPGEVKRGGRPPKPERLTEVVKLRLPAPETDELYREALRLDMSLSGYLRDLIRKARVSVVPKPSDPSAI